MKDLLLLAMKMPPPIRMDTPSPSWLFLWCFSEAK